MNNSLKIGIISGLIAGIVASLVNISFYAPLIFKLGLPYYYIPQPPETPFIKIAITEITITFIWGIILGIIYSKIHDMIPGKGVFKGLIFGLAYYLIYSIRIAIFHVAYGSMLEAASALLLIAPIVYGLVLGILYKAPKEKLKIKKHEILSGVIPGAITGFIFGTAVIISFVISTYFGVILGFLEIFPDYLADFEFIIYQFMNHGWINMLWYAVFGAIYAEFYYRIPGRSIIKGAIFGLIIWLITSFRISLYWLAYGSLSWAFQWGLLPDLYIFVGILLEGVYRRQPRAIIISGIVYAIVIIRTILLGLLS